MVGVKVIVVVRLRVRIRVRVGVRVSICLPSRECVKVSHLIVECIVIDHHPKNMYKQ